MSRADFIRKLIGPIPMGLVSLTFLAASLGLSWTAQHNQTYGHWYTTLLVVNLIGIATLGVFFLVNLLRLARQYKKRVMGSRLMVRFVLLFVTLTLLPIATIYYFATQFVRSGVDSWFDSKIEKALEDAELLGISFLEASKENLINNAQADTARLGLVTDDREMIVVLEELRRRHDYQDIALFTTNGQIVASSHQSARILVPDRPAITDLRDVANGRQIVKLEPVGGSLQYRLLVPVYTGRLSAPPRVLQIQAALPNRFARLGETLQAAATEYDRLNYLRRPLKISFVISLSAITLMTTLISLWLALYAARRLVAPISTLAEGTQAMTEGNYQTRLTVKSDDEFGQLVHSFNAMTRRVSASQKQLAATQAETEAQRAYLQTILEHLSSGVMSFDAKLSLQTANDEAANILSINLHDCLGEKLPQLANNQPRIAPLAEAIQRACEQGTAYQETELRFEGDQGGQILSVKITRIQPALGEELGYVVMFDDVTQLVQAEREAAWGEVARRLAHEIKNPLTPIQLSSERLRRKLMGQVPESEKTTLDRATRTISEQVDAMKRMVDAFSNYARSARLQLDSIDLNALIEDVVELHRPGRHSPAFQLELDNNLPPLQADRDSLRQVLNNLIGNAVDALEKTAAPQITVHTAAAKSKDVLGIELTLRDNGCGIDADIFERIFEPYVTSKSQGTGLGLAIVKRIIDRHQGSIRVQTPDEGGTEVQVFLPLMPDAPPASYSDSGKTVDHGQS